jgi:hypothetical protein
MLPKLNAIECKDPLVPCSVPGAVWVEPKVACRVRFAEWTKDWFLKEPLLAEVLQSIAAQ